MNDLISRSALREQLLTISTSDGLYGMGIQIGVNEAIKATNEAPAVDAVPVVRCKDCGHVFICNCQSCRQGVSVYCGKYGKHMTLTDYCSYGERRNGDG